MSKIFGMETESKNSNIRTSWRIHVSNNLILFQREEIRSVPPFHNFYVLVKGRSQPGAREEKPP